MADETTLEMVQRHVREGEAIIRRQRRNVAESILAGRDAGGGRLALAGARCSGSRAADAPLVGCARTRHPPRRRQKPARLIRLLRAKYLPPSHRIPLRRNVKKR